MKVDKIDNVGKIAEEKIRKFLFVLNATLLLL